MSASVLDRTITQSLDKKQQSGVGPNAADFKYYENYIELQSLELACFVLSVCNVVLVAEDWFCDPSLLRYTYLYTNTRSSALEGSTQID